MCDGLVQAESYSLYVFVLDFDTYAVRHMLWFLVMLLHLLEIFWRVLTSVHFEFISKRVVFFISYMFHRMSGHKLLISLKLCV